MHPKRSGDKLNLKFEMDQRWVGGGSNPFPYPWVRLCAPPLAHRSGVFRAHGASIVRRYFTRLQLIRELVLTWNMGSYAVEFTSFSSPRSHRWLLTAYIQAKRHVSDSIDFGYRSCVEADTAAGQGQLNVCSWNSRWFYEFAVLHYQFTAVSRLWRLTVRLMSADTLANSITYS